MQLSGFFDEFDFYGSQIKIHNFVNFTPGDVQNSIIDFFSSSHILPLYRHNDL